MFRKVLAIALAIMMISAVSAFACGGDKTSATTTASKDNNSDMVVTKADASKAGCSASQVKAAASCTAEKASVMTQSASAEKSAACKTACPYSNASAQTASAEKASTCTAAQKAACAASADKSACPASCASKVKETKTEEAKTIDVDKTAMKTDSKNSENM